MRAPVDRCARISAGAPAPDELAGDDAKVRRRPPDTARLLISDVDRETIRADLLADRAAYATPTDADSDDTRASILATIDAALLRLDTPTYGYCGRCGVRIATARLLELPHTQHCLECAAATSTRSLRPVRLQR